MKNLKLLLSLLMTIVIGTGTMWAADIVVTLDNIGADLGSTANTEAATTDITATGTTDSYTLNYYQCKKQGNAMLMTKSVSPYISNHTAMPGNIKSVEVFINSGAAGKTTYDCAFSTTEVTSATSGVGAVNITGGNSNVFSNLDGSTIKVKGKYFCVTLGNANNGQVLKLVITCEGSTGPELAFKSEGNAITELDFGTVELNSGYVSKTFTLVGANLTNGVRLITNGALWSVSPTAMISPESDGTINKTITVYISTDKANGVTAGVKDSYLHAEWADDPKPEGSKNDTLQLLCELVEPVTPTYFSIDPDIVSLEPGQTEQLSTKGWLPIDVTNTAVTWESDDESIATVDANGLVTAVATGFATITATSVADPSVTATRDIEVKAHVVAPDAYDIVPNNTFFNTTANGSITGDAANLTYSGTQNDITVTYAKGSQSNMYINGSQTRVYNGSVMTFSVPAGFAITAIAFTADGSNWNGEHTANVGEMTDNKNWAGNANSVTITFKGTCRITNIKVTYAIASSVATPTISGETPFLGTTTVSMNCATDGTTIYYTTDGSDPTNESTPYTAAFTIDATTTIKAIAYNLGEHSAVETKTFTKATVYSVEDALGVIDALNEGAKTPDSVYVTGYVKSISEIDVESFHNATYLIQDAGVNHELTVFRGKNMNNTDFTSEDQLQVGQLLIIKGILQKYKNNGTGVITPEFIQGNYIVERVPKGGVASIALGGELTKTSGYEAGDNISVAGLTATAVYANGFMEDVTAEAVWTIDGNAEGTILSASEQHTIRATYEGKYAEDAYDFEANEHTVTFADPENGTLEIEDAGSPVASGDAFVKGTTLYITATSDAGYQLGSITVNGNPFTGDEITVGTEDITIAATFVEETPVYSVVGPGVDYDGIFPKNWDPADTETEMTLNEGVYSYTLENVTLQASVDYAYKIVKGHTWGEGHEYPASGNATFSVAKDGKYNVTFTLNPSTGTYNANPELIQEIAVNRKFAVAGDFNSWSTTPVELTPDAAIASITISNLTKGDYAFKVIVNGAWLGNGEEFTRANNSFDITTNGSDNMTLHVDVPGDYVFTWTYETNKLEITYPAKPALPMEWSKKDGYTITYGENIDESEYSRLMIAPSLQGLEITVTSDAPEIASYNSKGYAVDGYTVYYDIHKAGVATITASFAGNEDYAETSVSYTLTVNKGDSKLEWSTTSFNADVRTDAFDYPELSFAADIDVSKITYSSDENEVATVDADGKVTLLQGGYAVLITATFAGDDKYENAEASYWLSTEKVDPVLDWSESTASATIGESNEFPTLNNEDNVPVTYSSDNDAAVYINPQTGEITLLQPGTVTISASFDGNGLFNSAYAEYTLTVAGEAVEDDLLLGLDLSSYEFEINAGEALPKPTVEAHYSLSGNIDVTADAIFDDAAFNNAIAGTYTITVSYNDGNSQHAEATYTVKVKDTATAIGNAEMGEKAVKVIENNQLIIIKNGVKYTISGSKIR